jgi:hypothetical protein
MQEVSMRHLYFVLVFVLSACTDLSTEDSSSNEIESIETESSQRITLNWQAPTQPVDGTDLLVGEIESYKIYWGSLESTMTESIVLGANARSHVFEGLTPGFYFFAITAFNVYGAESVNSNTISKEVK